VQQSLKPALRARNATDPFGLAPGGGGSWEGWEDAGQRLLEWWSGVGKSNRDYGPGTIEVQEMQDAPGVTKAFIFWYYKNLTNFAQCHGLDGLTDYRARFGPKGAHDAGFNGTRQFLGGYSVDIIPVGWDTIEIQISNVTSMKSFLADIGP